jgi:hypothetical protein
MNGVQWSIAGLMGERKERTLLQPQNRAGDLGKFLINIEPKWLRINVIRGNRSETNLK